MPPLKLGEIQIHQQIHVINFPENKKNVNACPNLTNVYINRPNLPLLGINNHRSCKKQKYVINRSTPQK